MKKGDVLAEVTSKNVLASYEISHATLRQAEDGYKRVKKVHESGTVADVKLVEIETQLAMPCSPMTRATESWRTMQIS